jgi:recombinational DNA repair ATPase RecF
MDIADEKFNELGEQLEAGRADLQRELNDVFAELKAIKTRKQLLESRLAAQTGALSLMAKLIEMEESPEFVNEMGGMDDG